IMRNYAALLRHKSFFYYSLAGGMGSAGMFAYLSGSPRVFVDVMAVDVGYVGVLIGLNAAVLIVASQVNVRLLNRYSPQRVLRYVLNLLAAMPLAAVFPTLVGVLNVVSFTVCVMGFMAARGFVNPNSTALALAQQGKRLGSASALL